jgi:hypothetical protein
VLVCSSISHGRTSYENYAATQKFPPENAEQPPLAAIVFMMEKLLSKRILASDTHSPTPFLSGYS